MRVIFIGGEDDGAGLCSLGQNGPGPTQNHFGAICRMKLDDRTGLDDQGGVHVKIPGTNHVHRITLPRGVVIDVFGNVDQIQTSTGCADRCVSGELIVIGSVWVQCIIQVERALPAV
ncbi:MAG: hypothetical protein ACD_62C00157G0001 [uncultured bacterium]|nr:MAG: hypothetical protein ACD_62C00157G0001 [uncultured bacterium]